MLQYKFPFSSLKILKWFSPVFESQICSPFVANMHTLLLGEKTESEGWGVNKILQNGVYVTLLGQKQEGSHGEEVSLTIDSEVENLVKFYSSSEAGSSPVVPTVLKGQVLNPQGCHIGHMDPVPVLVLEADPGWGVCPPMYSQQDSVVWLRAKAPWDLLWFSFLLLGHVKQHRTSSDPLQGNTGSRFLNFRITCTRPLGPRAADA